MAGIPRKYLVAAIIWAIIGVIGILIMIMASSPPWVMDLGEMIGLIGLVGSWITVLTGATIGGQMEIIGAQREIFGAQRELIGGQRELIRGQKEIVRLLRILTKGQENLSKDHREILRTLKSFTAKSKRR